MNQKSCIQKSKIKAYRKLLNKISINKSIWTKKAKKRGKDRTVAGK